MITTIFIGILGTIMRTINFVLSGIQWYIPNNYIESVQWTIAQLGYFSGVINIPDIFEAIGWLLLFSTWWFIGKTVLWIVNLMPFYHGKKIRMPFQDK